MANPSAPELNKALEEYRHHGGAGDGPSMRSLSHLRGEAQSSHTLNYDEVVALFKRFQGGVRGTVQYTGALMKLLDVPSKKMALDKAVRVLSLALEEQGSTRAVEKVSRKEKK